MSVLTNPVVTAMIGAALAAAVTIPATPIPGASPECQTYRVRQKVATSYALRPPPATPIEHVVVKEAACVSPKAENVTQPELTNTDDTQEKPRRHRRHHRVRRYWR